MDLLRHWRRRTFGAAAGVLIIPAVILVAALLVGFGGGGLGGLGAFGQAFGGPEAPAVAPTSLSDTAREANRLLARVSAPDIGRARAVRIPPSVRSRVPSGGDGDGPSARPPAPNPTAPAPTDSVQAPTDAPTTPPAPASTTAPAPAATAAPEDGPVRQITNVVTVVTDQVPGVGRPVSQVVDDTADAVDGLLGP